MYKYAGESAAWAGTPSQQTGPKTMETWRPTSGGADGSAGFSRGRTFAGAGSTFPGNGRRGRPGGASCLVARRPFEAPHTSGCFLNLNPVLPKSQDGQDLDRRRRRSRHPEHRNTVHRGLGVVDQTVPDLNPISSRAALTTEKPYLLLSGMRGNTFPAFPLPSGEEQKNTCFGMA